MITRTPRRFSRFTCLRTAAATISETSTLRGEETWSSSGVVAPITPTLTLPPRFLRIVLRAIRPLSTSSTSSGSPLKSVFALRKGTVRKPRRNWARTSGPKSYSWLPIVAASKPESSSAIVS